MKYLRMLTLWLVLMLTVLTVASCQGKEPTDTVSTPTITATDSQEALETARRFTEAALTLDVATVTELTPEFMMRYYLTQYGYEIGDPISASYQSMLEEQLATAEDEPDYESEFISCALDTEYDLNAFYSDLSFYGLTAEETASIEAYTPVTVVVKTAGNEVKNSIVCAKITNTWYVLV